MAEEHVHPIYGKPIGWIYDQPVYNHRHRTGAEIMRVRGLPTAQDLREQYWRRRMAEAEAAPAAAAHKAAAAEAAPAAAPRETPAAAAEEEEEVDNLNPCATTEEVKNLNPCATASTIERRGGSQIAVSQASTTWVVHRQGGFSRATLVKNSNPAKTYLSGTGADLKGKSLLKDLGGTSGTVDGSLNPVANLTSASSASTTQVIERGGGSSFNKDLGESSGTTLFDLSGTGADLEGKSLLKDLGGTSETVDGYLNPAANLTSASSASTTQVIERGGGSSLNKDLGGSSGTTLFNLSGTRADLKGKSLPKDLDESSETVDGYMNSAANLTSASSAEMKRNFALKRPHKDLGESNKSMVKSLNLAAGSSAATIIASVTKAEFEGESVY